METNETSIFSDLESQSGINAASTQKRFVNYFVDMILFYVIQALILNIFDVITAAKGAPLIIVESAGFAFLIQFLFTSSLLVCYYTLIEGITGGRSIGKMLTNTVAIRLHGGKFRWKDALIRSLCRIVPFEALSGFSDFPWHDTWSQTIVVNKRVFNAPSQDQ